MKVTNKSVYLIFVFLLIALILSNCEGEIKNEGDKKIFFTPSAFMSEIPVVKPTETCAIVPSIYENPQIVSSVSNPIYPSKETVYGVRPYIFDSQWGSKGNGNGEFDQPIDIAIDSDGYVYVIDYGNTCIQKFDSNGKFILRWGSNGSDDGQFCSPSAITVDFLNDIYVVDNYNPETRIQKFTSTGQFITKWNLQQWSSTWISADANGYIYASNYGIFDCYGNFIEEWKPFTETKYIHSNFPFDLGIVDIFAPNSAPGCLEELTFDSDNNIISLYSNESNQYVYNQAEPGSWPKISFVSQATLIKFDYWGNLIQRKYIGDGYNFVDLTIDKKNDNILLSDCKNNCICIYSSNFDYVTKFGSEGSGEGLFKEPRGIALDNEGKLYVVDRNNNRIQKFSPNSDYWRE